MNKRSWLFFFAFSLIVNSTGGLLENEWIEFISKPLIIISLALYFIFQTKFYSFSLKKWILLALLFSWTGDVLLMFHQNDQLFFLLGLSAFLVAHIFYIVFFHLIRVRERLKSNLLLLLVVVIYYAMLIGFLSPYLGDMKLLVRIYGIVISFMFLLAMHMLFIKNKIAGRLMMMGASLFVISDSILAINKFYQPFEMAGATFIHTLKSSARIMILQMYDEFHWAGIHAMIAQANSINHFRYLIIFLVRINAHTNCLSGEINPYSIFDSGFGSG